VRARASSGNLALLITNGPISMTSRGRCRSNDPEFELINLNPNRMDRSRMDALMSAIKHEDFATSGLDLSTIWTNDRKRNYDLVCIVTSGPGRAINADGYFMIAQFGWDPVTCTCPGSTTSR
jgi:hypothetical protein